MTDILSLEPEHQKRILKKIDNPHQASHLIMRLLGPSFQQKFHHLLDLEKTPQVFIHGNPHLDNYARTTTGAGMIDFDRSRVGPYCWDLIRFFSSLALKSEKKRVGKKAINSFIAGYRRSFNNTDIFHSTPLFLRSLIPSEQEATTRNYLNAGIKWAKKMRKNPLKKNDPFILKALSLYLESRGELKLLKFYEISECGWAPGSLGKKHYLIALTPKENSAIKDDILIDLKETYNEEDGDWFYSPTEHQGERMIKASNLYAPGVEQRLGHFTINDKQYWGREVPSFKVKLPEILDESMQEELSFCVGSQLGRGHRRSYRGNEPEAILKHLSKNIDTFLAISDYLNSEIELSLEFLTKAQALKEEINWKQ